ncbi:hypothetical protein HZ326_12304 [Fusarium oxysporum f. sp. albedinis]|nr:hypothetical protein HZ326_12304 [Fusarium oxysporum f. sp. albedinis]
MQPMGFPEHIRFKALDLPSFVNLSPSTLRSHSHIKAGNDQGSQAPVPGSVRHKDQHFSNRDVEDLILLLSGFSIVARRLNVVSPENVTASLDLVQAVVIPVMLNKRRYKTLVVCTRQSLTPRWACSRCACHPFRPCRR